MTAVAALVVNWNGGELLRRCLLSALAQQPAPAEIVVVDNASTDGSVDELPSGVTLLRQPVNGGFGAAVNAGLAATRSPFVLTLNPDTELLPGCLAAAAAALEADLLLGCVAPRVLQAGDPERIDATGIGLTSFLGQINCDHGRLAAEVADERRPVLGPLGGAALWRRLALERAGGFAEQYFLYWEDFDVALRVNRAGYGCRTEPAARVLHVGSASLGAGSSRNVFYMVRNHWPCLMAALPGPVLRDHFLHFLLAPLRAAALYAGRGRPFAALAGLLCGAALVPAACWRRRALPRTGTSRKAAARVAELMSASDRDRLVMRAAAANGTVA